jgi:spermidine/putrescine transport system permease protein
VKKPGWFITLSALAVFAFLYLPLFCVAIFSVNASRNGLTWGGFTLSWYAKLLHNDLIQRAAWNSLLLAVVSTLISTLLGTLLALGIQRIPWGRRSTKAMEALLNLPVVTPDIIFAVALVIAFGALRSLTGMFQLGMPTMIVGHVAFQVAFVALVVRSRLSVIAMDLEEAAFDLYASYGRLLWTVVLPLLRPGIFAGAALAFTLSLDDFVISFFTSGPESITLPIFIYAAVHRGVTPEIHALSTLVMIATVVVVGLMQKLTAKSGLEVEA